MENASKALIIAGAILLSILIIAIGMYIYTNSHNSISEAGSQISEQEKTSFNQQWNIYEGAQGGNNIKVLLQKVIANCNTNAQEESRLVGIKFYYSDRTKLVLDVKPSDDMNETISNLTGLRNSIDTRHTYYVTIEYDSKTSMVHTIVICYHEDQETAEPSAG